MLFGSHFLHWHAYHRLCNEHSEKFCASSNALTTHWEKNQSLIRKSSVASGTQLHISQEIMYMINAIVFFLIQINNQLSLDSWHFVMFAKARFKITILAVAAYWKMSFKHRVVCNSRTHSSSYSVLTSRVQLWKRETVTSYLWSKIFPLCFTDKDVTGKLWALQRSLVYLEYEKVENYVFFWLHTIKILWSKNAEKIPEIPY